MTGREKSGSCVRNPGSALAIAIVAALLACAGTEKTAAPPPSGVISEGVASETATVEKIDVAKRLVTLRGADGRTIEMKVDESVRNLPQVKKGDQVIVTYYESLEIQLRKKGTATPGVTEDAAVDRAAVGQMPGAAGAQAVTVVARITAIDRKTQMVTLQGPKGKTKRIHVKNPAHLANARVGDLVEATYTEAVAVAVEKPGATK